MIRIEDLRNIGGMLFREVSAMRRSPEMKKPMGVGAAGDRAYLIDMKADEIIMNGLEALQEPFTVISEESGHMDIRGGGDRVIIDPIDGSRNAIAGVPFYCSSIAVANGDSLGDVSLSYIINLVTGDEFWAAKGTGAYFNGERMRAQDTDEFSLVAYEAQSPKNDMAFLSSLLIHARKTRCFGSTALDLAYLSLGTISLFVCPSPSRSFDFAGGWLLVRESGGVISDTQGREISSVILGLQPSSPLLASGNFRLHKIALTLIGKQADIV